MTDQPHIPLTFHSADNDNCRVYFETADRTLFCFQLEKRNSFEFFECTEEGEPLCHADADLYAIDFVYGMEATTGIAKEYNDWFDDNVVERDVNPALSY